MKTLCVFMLMVFVCCAGVTANASDFRTCGYQVEVISVNANSYGNFEVEFKIVSESSICQIKPRFEIGEIKKENVIIAGSPAKAVAEIVPGSKVQLQCQCITSHPGPPDPKTGKSEFFDPSCSWWYYE